MKIPSCQMKPFLEKRKEGLSCMHPFSLNIRSAGGEKLQDTEKQGRESRNLPVGETDLYWGCPESHRVWSPLELRVSTKFFLLEQEIVRN